MRSVSVIIPNYNGREFLQKNLPILLKRLSVHPGEAEVIVVDDGSTDSSAEFVKGIKGVRLLALGANSGFANAVNYGVREAKGEIIYLLNSDVEVCEGFLSPLIRHFDDDKVFAVSSVAIKGLKDIAPGKKVWPHFVKFKYGIFWYWYECLDMCSKAAESFCVSGGYSAFDRVKFLELGGFDILFRPFYAEDGDICWRAWKKGYRSLIDPDSCVIHKQRGTIAKYHERSEISNIHWKNRFLMTWKDISDRGLLLKHLLFTIPELLICPLIGKKEFSAGFFMALPQIPEVIRSRRKQRILTEVYSDRDLFRKFSSLPVVEPHCILYLHETSVISGAENSLLNLAKNLDKKRFRPLFVLPGSGPLADELERMGVEVIYLGFPRVRSLLGVTKTVRKLFRIAREKKIRIIHSNSIRTHFYAAVTSRIVKVPVVWHQRNLLTDEIIDPDRLFSSFADRIICNSRAIADRFLSRNGLPGNVRVVHNGVDTQKFSPDISGENIRGEFGIGKEDIVVGIASRFNLEKGQRTFLKAAAEVIAALPELKNRLKFLVAGGAVFKREEEEDVFLKSLVSDFGLGQNVIFTGLRKDMPEIYAAMDIFVLASDAEPCGRVVLEAMACAKPLIATITGGTTEMAQDGITGYFFRPGDHTALAERIIFLIEHADFAKKMGQNGRSRAEACFKIETNARKVQDIYLELIGLRYG
ncbi:MAG: glycosyltransferase [Candidatus Omnitrophica bacterium]|nr:glycosyltransferase [Candidatus Omnitrophota bacterium]MDD5080260.1 glycosyltransferase [Candidatus Omnitrophota bacterium]